MVMLRPDCCPNTFALVRSDFRMKCADDFDSSNSFDENSICCIAERGPAADAFGRFDQYLRSCHGCCCSKSIRRLIETRICGSTRFPHLIGPDGVSDLSSD